MNRMGDFVSDFMECCGANDYTVYYFEFNNEPIIIRGHEYYMNAAGAKNSLNNFLRILLRRFNFDTKMFKDELKKQFVLKTRTVKFFGFTSDANTKVKRMNDVHK